MPFVKVIFTMVFLLDAYWWWATDRQLRPLPRARVWRSLLALFMGATILLLGSRMMPPRLAWWLNKGIPAPLTAAQYLWHLGVLPACIVAGFAIRGIVALISLGFRKPAPVAQISDADARPPVVTRRRFVATAALAPPIIAAATTGVAISQLGRYRTRAFDLRLANLPPKLDGVTIAHLSDFHAGKFLTPAMMRPIIDTVNEMQPDLILLTGDLIDYALADLPAALDAVRRLKPRLGFRGGLAMCMGNHDAIENRYTFRRIVEEAEVPLIIDAKRTIDVNGQLVQLLGVDWNRDEHLTADTVRQAAQVRDAEAFPILLAHHPHAFDAAAAAGLPLTLAGHTHGGQIMATPQFGAGSLIFRYWSGLYRKPNGSQLVVSNGIGNWFPLRVNAPAEILSLTLRRG
jgi:predicted MPP superfamily phosphohydrolase